jgi:hypothetical protein
MTAPSTTPTPADTFIERWSRAKASERANAQLFLSELSDLLEVPRPSNTHADGYTFEFPVKIPLRDGSLGDVLAALPRQLNLLYPDPLSTCGLRGKECASFERFPFVRWRNGPQFDSITT